MSVVTENITPAKAQEYLRTSLGNRPISKVYVRSYADTMRRGGWMLNGVPIIFDNNGHLQDGHHRLLAVIEAGIPVRFDVRRGAPAEAFTTYDTGRHRNISQILAMQGVKNYVTVGAIVSANETLIRSGRLIANNVMEGSTKRTLADTYELYCRDRDGYDKVGSYMTALQSKCRILPKSWEGGLFYYLTHTGGYTEERVRPFFDCLHDLDSNAIKPAALLRKAIAKEAMEGRKMQPETQWAFLVKAWNAYITGVDIKILRYQNVESLPSLILNE